MEASEVRKPDKGLCNGFRKSLVLVPVPGLLIRREEQLPVCWKVMKNVEIRARGPG